MIAPKIRLMIEKDLRAGGKVSDIASHYAVSSSSVTLIRKRIGVPTASPNARTNILKRMARMQSAVFGYKEACP